MIKTGINFRSVKTLDDLLLFKLENKDNQLYLKSDFYRLIGNQLEMIPENQKFYSEIFLSFTLQIKNFSSLMNQERILVSGETKNLSTWKFYLDEYGYLCFIATGKSNSLNLRSPLSLTSYLGEEPKIIKLGFSLNNYVYSLRNFNYWKEAIPYSRLLLLASSSANEPLEVLSQIDDFALPELNPVSEDIKLPLLKENENNNLLKVAAYNTARFELFRKVKVNGQISCQIDQNFSGASKVFPIYKDKDLIELFTGPEFNATTSYWLFAKVKNAVKNKTKFKVYLSIGHGASGMAPVFFWSKDRNKWFRASSLKLTNNGNNYSPTLLAPEKDFYLASSIPFLEEELNKLKRKVENLPYVKVINIGRTVEERSILLFKITNLNENELKKKHVAIIVGQHSPLEMIGAHLLWPIINSIGTNDELLKKIVIHFIPIVNVDCAHWGGNGSNSNGANLNRHWIKNLEPENEVICQYFENLRKQGINLSLFFDFHGGGVWRNHTVLRYSEEYYAKSFPKIKDELITKSRRALKILEKFAGFRIKDGKELKFRNCSARDYFKVMFPEAIAFDVEFSTTSYFDPIKKCSKVVTQESLKIIGEGFLKAVCAILDE